MNLSLRALAFATLATFAAGSLAQTPPPTDPPKPPAQEKPAEVPKKPEAKPGEPKPYDEVVTKEAKSQDGLFRVHRVGEKLLFEIPANMLGRDMLMQTEVAELPANGSFMSFPGAPAGAKLIRFTRRNNKIFLRAPNYDLRSEGDEAQSLGVQKSTLDPILMAFDVQAEGKDKSAVIDVTNLFTTDPQDFAAKSVVGGASADPARSYLDSVKAYPINIETRSYITFSKAGGRSPMMQSGDSAVTALVHYSLVLLPEKPMMGRLKDSRIGFFTQGFESFGRAEDRVMDLQYIDRFRLEKKDPSAAMSEPVQPITFYVAREVPAKWRPYIKQAIEDWQPAFEQAGFRHAIVAKDPPTSKDDPDFHEEDLRYSVIRWAPSSVENAMGPSIQDPRSGETISAHVIVWHNILKLVQEWYFSQCGAIDPQARKLPLPDKLMGQLVRYVVAHEVGHTLGLEHNMKGSSVYTIAQLRDPKFTSENGVSCSIMDYSRFNYVAQPGDGVTRTIGGLGPYDKFAIEYGYKPIPSAHTPDEEKPILNALLAKQIRDPRLRFGNYRYSQDPTTQSEDISNDAIEAGHLGLMNLDRVSKNLIAATTKPGEDYEITRSARQAMIYQKLMELSHVGMLVGGVVETDYHAGLGDVVFKPVPAPRQAAAVKFLLTEGVDSGRGMYSRALLNKLEPNGIVDETTMSGLYILRMLTQESRLKRLADFEATDGPNSYTLSLLASDLTNNVWHELSTPAPAVDIYHRALQRAFLKTMDSKINGPTASATDFKPLARQQLTLISARIDARMPQITDRMTRAHLLDCKAEIKKILEGKNAQNGPITLSLADLLGFDANVPKTGCWSPIESLDRAFGE